MKNIRFIELSILSNHEKSARKIKFNGNDTIIIGETSSGKSSVLKSLFYVFGAEPVKMEDYLKKYSFILLQFSIDEQIFYVMRNSLGISFFDKNKNLLHASDSITKGVSPFLYDIFGMSIKLLNPQTQELTQLTPAHFLKPFYIDQDDGWDNYLSSFKNTNYLKDWGKEVINYYIGLTNDKLYEEQTKRILSIKKGAELSIEMESLKKLRDKLDDMNNPATFNLDTSLFAQEVEALVSESNALLAKERTVKNKIIYLYGKKDEIEKEVQIIKQLIAKMGKTVENIFSQEHFECPTCGSHVEDTFGLALTISQDNKNYLTLLDEKTKDLDKVLESILKEKDSLLQFEQKNSKIRQILSARRDSIAFEDIINEAGRIRYREDLNKSINSLFEAIVSNGKTIADTEKNIRAIRKQIDYKSIREYYAKIISIFGLALEVKQGKEKNNIVTRLAQTGNEHSRALLAYFYTILTLALRYKSAAIAFPMVIDTPLQQNPDEIRAEKTLAFIEANKPKDLQLIVATSLGGEKQLKSNVITIEPLNGQRYKFLKQEFFEEVSEELSIFINTHINSLKKELFD